MGTISIGRLSGFATLSRTLRATQFVRPMLRLLFEYAANLFLHAYDRARQRYQLATMDECMLRDIGLTRADVAREAAKSFWQR